MKKIFVILASLIIMSTSLFASGSPTINVDKNIVCGVGNITDWSAELIAIDENADYFIFTLGDISSEKIFPNKYHYATKKFKMLGADKVHEFYVTAYNKNGQKRYSAKQVFRTLDPIPNISITEYTSYADKIVIGAIPNRYIGDVEWYLNGDKKGESFSTSVGFSKLKPDTEYTITAKATNFDYEKTIKIKTSKLGETKTFTNKNGVFVEVK